MSQVFSQWLFKTRKKKILTEVPGLQQTDPGLDWVQHEQLGDGNFGTVYKVTKSSDPSCVGAAKIIPIQDDEDPEQYTTELNILIECRHVHVVGLIQYYMWSDTMWLVLEYCDMGAVDSILAELDHGFDEEAIRIVTKQTLMGLVHLHNKGIIHRDLKASNLLLCSDATVKIADFGVSAKNSTINQKRLSHVGTPYWMAPEVVLCETMQDNPYDYKADIWSLGITQLELAEMNPPYHDMHPNRVLLKIPKVDPPGFLRPQLWSTTFKEFLSHALVKDAHKRWTGEKLLKHQWMASCRDNHALRCIIAELGAEVQVTQVHLTEEIDSDQDTGGTLAAANLHRLLAATKPPSCTPPSSEGSPPTPTKINRPAKLSDSDEIGKDLQRGNTARIKDQLEGDLNKQILKQSSQINFSSQGDNPPNKELYKRTRSKTYKVDGETFVRQTEDIINDEEEPSYSKRIIMLRKEEERSHKQLQKNEIKEIRKIMNRLEQQREELRKKKHSEIDVMHRTVNTLLDKTFKDKKKEIEKKEAQHQIEIKALTELMRAEKKKWDKEFAKRTKSGSKASRTSSKRQDQTPPGSLRIAEETILKDQSEALGIQGREHKLEMFHIEIKYLEITKQIVLDREKSLNNIEMNYTSSMHTLLKEQLLGNFEHSAQHVETKHKMEQEHCRRMLTVREARLLREQEVDRNSIPKKLKHDRKKRMVEVKSGISSLSRSESKAKLKEFELNQAEREDSIREQVKEVQRKQMEDFSREKEVVLKQLLDRQAEKMRSDLANKQLKIRERDELYDKEKRSTIRHYNEETEKFLQKHETEENNIRQFYSSVGELPSDAYTAMPLHQERLTVSYHKISPSGTLTNSNNSSPENNTSTEESFPAIRDSFNFLNDYSCSTTTRTNSTMSSQGTHQSTLSSRTSGGRAEHAPELNDDCTLDRQFPRMRLVSDPGTLTPTISINPSRERSGTSVKPKTPSLNTRPPSKPDRAPSQTSSFSGRAQKSKRDG